MIVKCSANKSQNSAIITNHRFFSCKPCKVDNLQHKTKSKQEMETRVVSKLNETDIRCGNQSIVHEKYYSSLQCCDIALLWNRVIGYNFMAWPSSFPPFITIPNQAKTIKTIKSGNKEHFYNKMNDVVSHHRRQKIRRALVLIVIFTFCKLFQYIFECYTFVTEFHRLPKHSKWNFWQSV